MSVSAAVVVASSVVVDDAQYRAAISDALAQEIRFEMVRKGIPSSRDLAKRAGFTHTALNDRLHRNSRTGRKTPFTIPELAMVCRVLEVDALELLGRAIAAVPNDDPPNGAVEDPGVSDVG